MVVFVASSSRLVYPTGRDTYRTFGDGRFQLCHAHETDLMFCDSENSLLLSDAYVIDWLEVGNLIYLKSKDGLFHIVEQDGATARTFQALEQLDFTAQMAFKSMSERIRFLRWLSDRNLTSPQWLCVFLFPLVPIAIAIRLWRKVKQLSRVEE